MLVVEVAAATGGLASQIVFAANGWYGENDVGLVLIGLAAMAAIVAWILLVLTHRLYRNFRDGGCELRYDVSSAAWAWFVPFFNLVRPKQIIDDIWRTADPTRRKWSNGLIGCWWGFTIASGPVPYVAPVAATLGWVVVGRLIDDQDRRAASRGRAADPPSRRWWTLPAVTLVLAAGAALVTALVQPGTSTIAGSPARGPAMLDHLDAGTCFDTPSAIDVVAVVTVVPCQNPHDEEVFAVFELSTSRAPSAADAAETGLDECLARFTPFHGSFEVSDGLDVIVYTPDEQAWRSGDRTATSAVARIDGAPLVGSAAAGGG